VGMADDVWGWCEKANSRGRTVTVKIKWADFQISTRSRSMESAIQSRHGLCEVALDLIRSVFPPPKGVRLVGVTLSNFRSRSDNEAAELPFVQCNRRLRNCQIFTATRLRLIPWPCRDRSSVW
jgi:DNA polymerase IV